MKNIIIIGAGIAGLSAGIYARKSGFDVTIYESHTIPGGNCTSWRRGGYLFEGGMHWLTGSSPKTNLNKIWRETGALSESSRISNHDPFIVVDYNGESAALYRDAEQSKNYLLRLAPEDSKAIMRLYKDICSFTSIQMPIFDIPGLKIKNKFPPVWKMLVKLLPVMRRLMFLRNISVADYVAQFKNPLIQSLLTSVIPSDMNASSLVVTLGSFTSGDGGYVEGGSLAMADNMAKLFLNLGGIIQYGKKIDRVAAKDNKAEGVFIDGNLIPADAVIVAADTLSAIDTLFEKPLSDEWALDMRKSTELIACTFICLGVEEDLSHLPELLFFPLKRPFDFAWNVIAELSFHHYASYKNYAPEGCTSVTLGLQGDTYEYWKSLREQGRYEQGKEELFALIKDRLEEHYPIFKDKIKVWDIATPLTYERYCGTYRGSFMTKTLPGDKQKLYPSKSKSFTNVYFAGQRLMPPGGMPCAVVTGRYAAQHVCKDFDMEFIS